jgi:hypothetical protein
MALAAPLAAKQSASITVSQRSAPESAQRYRPAESLCDRSTYPDDLCSQNLASLMRRDIRIDGVHLRGVTQGQPDVHARTVDHPEDGTWTSVNLVHARACRLQLDGCVPVFRMRLHLSQQCLQFCAGLRDSLLFALYPIQKFAPFHCLVVFRSHTGTFV